MLETLRKGAATWVAKIFIGILVLSFAIWGIADIFGGYGQQTVAVVGKEEISQYDYQRAYQDELRSMSRALGKQLTADQARALGIESRVLTRLIAGAALDSKADELNLGVTDKAIADNIVRDPNFFDQSGKFNRRIFDQLLYSNGLNEASYVVSQREATIRKQLTDAMTRDLALPDAYLSAVNKYQNERRSIRYFSLPASSVGEIEKPDDSTLKQYYDSRKREFTAPEYRKLSILTLDSEEIAKSIDIPEEEIKADYEDHKADFTVPERREIQQIPFPDLKTAEEAYKKLKSGTSFDDLAKERGLSESDYKLGLVSKEDLIDPKISEAAFGLKKDEFSKPVEGKLATVILRVTNILDELERPYEEVKKQIKEKLAKAKAEEEAFNLHDKIEDERAAGSTLKEIASQLNLTYLEFDEIDRDGRDVSGKKPEKFPTNVGFVVAAFKSDVGVENDPVENGKGGFIWFDVMEVIAEKLKPFDQIKADVEKSWRSEEQRKLLRKKAQEIIDRLKGGAKLADVAKEFGAEVKEIKPFRRDASFTGLPESLAQQVFVLPKGGFGSVGQRDGSARIIFKVEDIVAPDALSKDEEKNMKSRLERQIVNDILAQYVTALQNNYGVNINKRTLELLSGTGGST